MEIITGNKLTEIKNIVNLKSRYQKIMLVYDETVSDYEIQELYNSIKEECVFNKMQVSEFDEKEIFNGYKLIVFYCSADSFLKLNFNRSEFANVYIPTDNYFLPFLLNCDNCAMGQRDYIYLNKPNVDMNLMTSVYFNQFYYNLKNIKEFGATKFFTEYKYLLGAKECLGLVLNECKDLEFVDVKILKKTGMSYNLLPVLNLVLVDGFILFLNNVKYGNFVFVDLYKSIKEDYDKIDKFFALSADKAFFHLLSLNYNFLINLCQKAKEKILEFNNFYSLNNDDLENVFVKLKQYAKSSDDLIAYFYLFNYFGV